MQITFTVPGRVGGKGRPKFSRAGSFVRVYTPAKTRSDEANVKSYAMAAMQGRKPLEGPLWLDIRVQLVPPPSWSRRKRAEAFFVTGKPDLDNVLKLIGDALNGVCWVDDAQISVVQFARTYDLDQVEHVSVRFGELVDKNITIERPDWAPQELPLFNDAARRVTA